MENNVTVITGGSGGIGRSVVRKFLGENDKVIVLDRNEIKDEKILSHENFEFIQVDITDFEQIQKAKEAIKEKYGHVNNVISMAGVNMKSEIGGMETITLEDIDKSIKLNLNSHIYLVKIFSELLKKSDSKNRTITMISSINAISDHGLPAYSAAKSGLYGFMKSISREMGNIGIRVNTVSLGSVPHNNEVIEGNEYFQNKLQKSAIKDLVRPKDVADTLYSLVYTMRGIVGQNIVLDMGQSI